MAGNAIIIGASRGLGAGLARELASRGWQVVATQRTPSDELAAAAQADRRIAIETVDIDDADAVTALAARLGGRRFDLVFVNAGVMGPAHGSAQRVTRDELAALMLTNAVAPVRTARALLPLVADGGTVAFMTSALGSVARRTHGSAELYSASKAALNSLTRGFFAADVGARPVKVLNIHPGWVKTAMGGASAPIDVATSVKGIADVIEHAAPGQHFLDYTGAELPW